MGFERRGSNLYYYHKERIGNRVVSQYIGRGDVAELFALLSELDKNIRMAKSAERQREREMQEADMSLDRRLDELGNLVRGLLRVALLSNNYHTHKGQWRKRRD